MTRSPLRCRAVRRLGKPGQHGFGTLAGEEARPAEVDLEPSIAQLVGQQGGRSLEQREPGAEILPFDRASPGERQPFTCAGGECSAALVLGAQLQPVAIGLLEVVAEQLVELDELGAVLLEPVGEPLVQLGPLRLRERRRRRRRA